MSELWIALALLAALAVVLVLLPLRGRSRAGAADVAAADARRAENLALYRQQRAELEAAQAAGTLGDADLAAARLELDRRLLDDTAGASVAAVRASGGRGALLACALAVPVLALLLYRHLGATPEIELAGLIAQLEGEMPAGQRTELLARLQPKLEAQVRRSDPGGDYRFLLARLYTAGERYPEAAALYAELVDLYPEDASLIAQSAQALYLAGGRKLTPAVQALIDRAFAIDPAQGTLLGLVGMDRFQAGDYRGAVNYWQKLLERLPADAPDAAMLRDGIAVARSRLGESAGEAPPATATTAAAAAPAAGADSAGQPAAAGPRLQVAVSLAPGLELRPGDTVFVFARAVGGPPMPLAVARFPAAELPRAVELSDAMAMAPGMTLSSFRQVSVVARTSRQGGVSAQPGDLEGGGEPLTLNGGEQAVSILIDRTI